MTVDLLSELRESEVARSDVTAATDLYNDYYPEPEVPDTLTDWTSIKELWGELSGLSQAELGAAIRDDPKYSNPLLCDWLLTRARRVSSVTPDRALPIAEAALLIARQRAAEAGDAGRLVSALNTLAWSLVTLRDFRRAERTLGELKEMLASEAMPDSEQAAYLATTGLYCSWTGDFERGESYLRRALNLQRQSGSRREVICQLVNLAGAVLTAGNSLTALEFYREAETLLRARDDPPRLQLAVYSNLVLALCESGLTVEARSSLATVDRLANTVGGWYSRAYGRWLHGTLLAAEGCDSKAEQVFEQVRDEFITRGHLTWFVEASLDLAGIYVRQGRSAALNALASDLLLRTGEAGVDQRIRAAAVSFADAVAGRALTSQLLASLAIALSSAKERPISWKS